MGIDAVVINFIFDTQLLFSMRFTIEFNPKITLSRFETNIE